MVRNVLEYLESTAERIAHKPAFCSPESELSFGQVLSCAKSIGSGLVKLQLCGRPVVVLMDRSPEMACAFYGCTYAGCPYVPLDREMGRIRLELIFGRLQPGAVICDAASDQLAHELEADMPVLGFDELVHGDIDDHALNAVRRRAIDSDPLYIIYTSGSTGVPKGVAVSHRSVIDYAETFTEAFGIDETTVFGNQTAFYFDGSLKELYSTPKTGAVTWIIPKKLFMFPVKLIEFLNEHRVNTICWVSSTLSMVSSVGTFEEILPGYLRTVIFSGEVFASKQCMAWRKAVPGARFFNLYGPTETTGTNLYYEVTRDFSPDEIIPIGAPYPNTQYILLRQDGTVPPDGEPGELCIRGVSLALGYWNEPEQTARVFVRNPLRKEYTELIYKTGDLARVNERGELEFVARADDQIKHMGQRLEPGEVELAAARCEGVELACCIGNKSTGRLSLFYTGAGEPRQVTAALRQLLPKYMVPSTVRRMDTLPLLPNGKVDRKALKDGEKK